MVVIILTAMVMIALVVLSFYKSPTTTGIGIAMYALGIPIYYLGTFLQSRKTTDVIMGEILKSCSKCVVHTSCAM